ncbi:hypothetical protein HOP50_14g73170 [Chloropicon primus]|nr:hypothetical protein HOP50_14g73170 [Chloropicon primus]
MSSLKGQLSNVEGSVKSMKAAVVVGSVLTVACLAAVFGVTILANEVSKEVKVSNGTLTAKNGQAVLTTTIRQTNKVTDNAVFTTLNAGSITATMKINAKVYQDDAVTLICDDAFVLSSGKNTEFLFKKDSILASVVGAEEVESRNLSAAPLVWAIIRGVGWAAKACWRSTACRGAIYEAARQMGAWVLDQLPDPPQM